MGAFEHEGVSLQSLTIAVVGRKGVTSAAVGPDGGIYLAGRATDQIARLGGDVQELEVSPDAARKDGKCQHAFVARLSADGAKTEWVRHAMVSA